MPDLPFNAKIETTYFYRVWIDSGWQTITTNYDADPATLQVHHDGKWIGGVEKMEAPKSPVGRISGSGDDA